MLYVNQSVKPLSTKINDKGNLEISGCDLVDLAEKYSTPLYVLDEVSLRKMAQDYKDAFSKYEKVKILFASKSLLVSSVAKIFASFGFGFDVVSLGEMHILDNAKVSFENVSFNGNNKTKEEILYALNKNVARFSVDNLYELKFLNELAKSVGKVQKIHLRITPGIECHTHEYIQTGQIDSKFGFDLSKLNEAVKLIQTEYRNLELMGLHAHIGSQIFEKNCYYDEVQVILKEIKKLNDTFNINLKEINIGGGLGVSYTKEDNPPSVFEIADTIISSIEEGVKKYNLEKPLLYIEPGRSLVCSSGFSLYTIGSEKIIPSVRKYVAVDGGMTDNIRPAIYQAQYSAQIANKKDEENYELVTVAGKCCESGDILIKDIMLNSPVAGDILCVFDTGAYCYSMSSNYNSALKPAMVLINNGQSDIIVKRQSLEQLVQNDVILDRL